MAGQPTAATLAQNSYALDQLIQNIQGLGAALSGNDGILSGAKARIDALVGAAGVSDQLKANGQALRAKTDALTSIQADVEGATASLNSQAATLRNDMETNPLYSFLQTDTAYWGSRMYDILNDLLNRTGTMINQATALLARVKQQNSDVSALASEIKGTEDAAAGTGALPMIQGIINSTVGTTASALGSGLSKLAWPIGIVVGVIGLVYLTAPQLMRRQKNPRRYR